MNQYIVFDHVEQEVEQSEALDVLYRMAWLGLETRCIELSGLDFIAESDGIAMYYQAGSDTYLYIDTQE